MKRNNCICIILSVAMLLAASVQSEAAAKSKKKSKDKKDTAEQVEKAKETPYQKLFKDKKYSTEKGLFTIHLTEDKDIIFELPKNLLGKDMIVTSTVESTTDGGYAFAGFTSPKFLHVRFKTTDSLVLLTKVSPRKFITDESNVRKAVNENNIDVVLMSFPIEALSPDSTCVVFKPTEFFKTQYPELDLTDQHGGNSFGGILQTELTYDSQRSTLTGIKAFKDNVSVYGIEGYTTRMSFAGMSFDESDKISIATKRSIVLLPEKEMVPRYADPRIGVRTSLRTKFSGKEQGSSRIGYACRWNFDEGKELTFYIDTLFSEPMADAIRKGIEAWNDAFVAAGLGKRIRTAPYPSDSSFNSDDFMTSCVKFDVTTSNSVRSHSFIDPRSGEILSAEIYVPCDVLREIHGRMVIEIGNADPSVNTASHNIPIVYEGLQSIISGNVASCLGLSTNLSASYAVPVDSLRSASFTSNIGLACSITDNTPYNFIAKAGDKEKGVKLVNTVIGPYDKYAVRWLYGKIEGASTPEEELPYLDKMIKDSRKDPYCLYVRYQPAIRKDPRVCSFDLGNDPIKTAEIMKENFSSAIRNLDTWLPEADKNYSFMPYVNAAAIMGAISVYSALEKQIGGIYMNEAYEGDGMPSYGTVPYEEQSAAFKYLLESFEDMTWLDKTNAYKDVFFMRCPSGFLMTMIMPDIVGCIENTKLCSSVADGRPYTPSDAYKDVFDIIYRPVREGKTPSFGNIYIQYLMLSYTLDKSNVVMKGNSGKSLAGLVNDMKKMRYAPALPQVAFDISPEISHQMYKYLLDIRKTYERGIQITGDESSRNHYKYLVMAIDRALKID